MPVDLPVMTHCASNQTSVQKLRFLERFGVFTRKRGNILFLSRHRILDDIASDLADGLASTFSPDRKLAIYVGLHKFFGPDVWRRGYRIGIQTEHYFDQEGDFIGRRKWEIPIVLKAVRKMDAVLEINPGNRPIYDALPIEERSKIVFGPHIFPQSAPGYANYKERKAIFFGTPSDRRRKILGALDQDKFHSLSGGHFGPDLVDAARRYAAILNIHFDAGVFTEAPKLLLALKSGKPLVSETLSSEWEPHVHYIPTAEFNEETDLKQVYDAMVHQCCDRFSLQGFLENLLAEH